MVNPNPVLCSACSALLLVIIYLISVEKPFYVCDDVVCTAHTQIEQELRQLHEGAHSAHLKWAEIQKVQLLLFRNKYYYSYVPLL